MNRNKELVKNTIIILIGKICTQAITFVLLPIYTNYLSTEEYGTVDLVITYISLLAPLISLQLEYAAFRFLIDVRNNENEKKKIITNVMGALSILTFLCIFIFAIVYSIFKFNNCIYLFLILIITMFANMLLQIARGEGKNTDYTIASFIAGASNAILSIIFVVFLKTGITGIFLSMIISNLSCFIYLFIKTKLYIYLDFKLKDKKVISRLLKYSIPMIPNSICWWVISISDRTIISIFLGLSANGIYSVAAKFSGLIVTIYNMFNLSWTESVSLHINDEDADSYLSDVFNATTKFFACGCLAIIAIMPIAFPILIGNDYLEAYNFIPFLILGSFFNIIMGMLSGIYIGKKKSGEMAKTSILAAISNIVINLLFVNKLKIWAAVISTIISFIIVSVYRIVDVKKYINIKIKYLDYIILLIIFIFTTSLYMINNYCLNIINILVIILFSIFLNKKMIKSIVNFLFNKLKFNKLV